MHKYTVLECKDCKHREMYPSFIVDGHKCKVCGSTICIPIGTGTKTEMQDKYNITIDKPKRNKTDITINVNTSELDRLAIGIRLYDMLDLGNYNNCFIKSSEGFIISDKTLEDMLKLVNPDIGRYVNGNKIVYPGHK